MIGNSAMAAITTRLTTEAIAAPVNPRSSEKIKIGSITALTRAPTIVAIIARRASPWLRRIAPPIIPTIRNGCAGVTIARKCTAHSAVRPVAPKSATICGKNTQTTAENTTPMMIPRISPLVAFCRAKARSRIPTARATSAETAIESPMPKAVVKNKIAPA
jgi:hypothetical protein